jgi:hypothetical protein
MVNRYESFGIVDSDTVSLASEQFIGQIEVKDNGLSINCDYWTVLEQIKNEARKTAVTSFALTNIKNLRPLEAVVTK